MFVKALEDDADAFVKRQRKKIYCIVSATDFGCPGFVRISYCVDEAMIQRSFKAFEKLKARY